MTLKKLFAQRNRLRRRLDQVERAIRKAAFGDDVRFRITRKGRVALRSMKSGKAVPV